MAEYSETQRANKRNIEIMKRRLQPRGLHLGLSHVWVIIFLRPFLVATTIPPPPLSSSLPPSARHPSCAWRPTVDTTEADFAISYVVLSPECYKSTPVGQRIPPSVKDHRVPYSRQTLRPGLPAPLPRPRRRAKNLYPVQEGPCSSHVCFQAKDSHGFSHNPHLPFSSYLSKRPQLSPEAISESPQEQPDLYIHSSASYRRTGPFCSQLSRYSPYPAP